MRVGQQELREQRIVGFWIEVPGLDVVGPCDTMISNRIGVGAREGIAGGDGDELIVGAVDEQRWRLAVVRQIHVVHGAETHAQACFDEFLYNGDEESGEVALGRLIVKN
ncbi:MAG TPA: hypothetical protein VHZ51_19280, partial [Ktedonobacteraceae bacterium]|nr:hypothetical protein [Ktedonobacteraceae bacterium]